MSIKQVNPAELYDGAAFGLSQAVIDEQSGLVYISGQVAWDHQFQITSDTVEGQTKKALENLKIVLAAAGSSVEKLLRVRAYVRGELGEQMKVIAPIFADFVGAHRPVFTGIGVTSLASPETLVEIEAIARR